MEYQVVMTASPFPKRDEAYSSDIRYQEQIVNNIARIILGVTVR